MTYSSRVDSRQFVPAEIGRVHIAEHMDHGLDGAATR